MPYLTVPIGLRLVASTTEARHGPAVYILHQPVLIALGLALSGIGLPHLPKFALIAPLSVALCFVLAHYIRKLPLVNKNP